MTPLETLSKFNHPKAIPCFCSFDDGVLKPGRDADLLEFKADLKDADNLTVGNFIASLRAEMKHGNEVRYAPRFFSDLTLKLQHVDYKGDDEEQQTDNGLTPVQFPLYEVDRYSGGIRVSEDSPVPFPPIGDLYDMEIVSVNMIVFISTTGGSNSTRIDIKVKEPDTVKKTTENKEVEMTPTDEGVPMAEPYKKQVEAEKALAALHLPKRIFRIGRFVEVTGHYDNAYSELTFDLKLDNDATVVHNLVSCLRRGIRENPKEYNFAEINPIPFVVNVINSHNSTVASVSCNVRTDGVADDTAPEIESKVVVNHSEVNYLDNKNDLETWNLICTSRITRLFMRVYRRGTDDIEQAILIAEIKAKAPEVKKPDVTKKVKEPEAEERNKERQEARQTLEKLGLPEGIVSFCLFNKVVGYNTLDNVRLNFYSKINVEKPVVSMLVTSIHDTVAVFHKEIQNLVDTPILFNVMPTNGTTKAVSAKLRYALDFNGVTVKADRHEIAGISDLFGKSSDEIWATLACREIKSVEMFVERFSAESKLTLGFNVYVSDVPGDRKPVAMAENPRQDKFDEIAEMSMTLGPRVEFDRREFVGILDGKYADGKSYMNALILAADKPLTYTQLFECIVNPRNECKTFRVDLILDDKTLGAVETTVLYTPGDSPAANSSFPYQFYLRKISPTGVIDSRTFFNAKEFIDLITHCVPELANSEVREIHWYPGSIDAISVSISRFKVYLEPAKKDGEEEQEPCHREFNKLFDTDPNNKWWERAKQGTVGMPAIEKAPILHTRTIRCDKPTLHLINLAIGLHIQLELEGPVLDEKGQFTGSIRYRKAGSKPDTPEYASFHIDVTEGALNTLSESSTETELYFGSIHGGGVIKCYLRTAITDGEVEG